MTNDRKGFVARVVYRFGGRDCVASLFVESSAVHGAVLAAERQFLAEHLDSVEIVSVSAKEYP